MYLQLQQPSLHCFAEKLGLQVSVRFPGNSDAEWNVDVGTEWALDRDLVKAT